MANRARVVAFTAEHHVIAIETPSLRRKVLRLQFSRRDGSLFLHFPYAPVSQGLVGVATVERNPSSRRPTGLTTSAAVTSQRVKYSHHPDGLALFSQDGRVLSKIRRQSVPLENINGIMFIVRLQGLEAFEPLSSEELSKRTARKTIHVAAFAAESPCFELTGSWFRNEDLVSANSGEMVGPEIVSGDERGIVLGPEAERPPHRQLVVLNCRPSVPPERAPGHFLLMLGAFDSRLTLLEGAAPTSFLTLAYPLPEPSKFPDLLGSVDLQRACREGVV